MSYVRLARSLKTYGVTFFLVKEKMKGKNKLVPRLLGVTKDSVLRLDEKSKEIMKTWPLTTVRRWAASPNTFTLGAFICLLCLAVICYFAYKSGVFIIHTYDDAFWNGYHIMI